MPRAREESARSLFIIIDRCPISDFLSSLHQYLELQKPLYERRTAIISGASQATAEEIEAGTQASLKDDPSYTPLSKDAEGTPAAIPEFWLTALRNHVGLSEIITERDAGALKSLTDIRLSYLSNDSPKPGFKITFIFSPNDFFENEILEKTYLYQEEVGYSGDFVYDRAIGTDIKWKEDKDLTKEFEIKKQRNKSMMIYILIEGYLMIISRHESHAIGSESTPN
jgi:nucleosome assembly protein 1-like 1